MSMISPGHLPRAGARPRGLLKRHSLNRLTTTDLEDARRLLCDCILLRKLAPHERNALAARARIRKFEAGDTIFLMGALNHSMVAVLDGEVRISMPTADGKEVVFAPDWKSLGS